MLQFGNSSLCQLDFSCWKWKRKVGEGLVILMINSGHLWISSRKLMQSSDKKFNLILIEQSWIKLIGIVFLVDFDEWFRESMRWWMSIREGQSHKRRLTIHHFNRLSHPLLGIEFIIFIFIVCEVSISQFNWIWISFPSDALGGESGDNIWSSKTPFEEQGSPFFMKWWMQSSSNNDKRCFRILLRWVLSWKNKKIAPSVPPTRNKPVVITLKRGFIEEELEKYWIFTSIIRWVELYPI